MKWIVIILFCCAATPMPPSPPAPLPYDLQFQWTASSNTNVVAYALYQGNHYPNWSARTVWFGTNAFVTNAPSFHTDYWVSALAGGTESVPSRFIPQDNGFQFVAVTVTCTSTGTVYRAATIGGPWLRMLINFHGQVGSFTNPPANQFFQGPGMKIDRQVWNE